MLKKPAIEGCNIFRYEDHGDPFLRLAPLKLEEMHDEPLIVVFRDFLVRREYEALKKVTLQTSTYGDTPWKKRGRDRMLARTRYEHKWNFSGKKNCPATPSFPSRTTEVLFELQRLKDIVRSGVQGL